MNKNDSRKKQALRTLSNAELRGVIGGAEIQSPRDAASGLPTGKRQHKPFIDFGETAP